MNLLTRIIPNVAGKMLLITEVNATHYGIKSFRHDGPVICNGFFRNIDNNNDYKKTKNLCNTGIAKFKNYLKHL